MENATNQQPIRKERVGVVASAAMNKTIIVVVERRMKHPIYGKFIKKSKRFAAHDERNEAREGDTVLISETRPLSKTKRWRLKSILERAK
jgi:small subunit ribosomal protein S17